MKVFGFQKSDRILKRQEFLEFFTSGRAVHSSGFVLAYKKISFYKPRIGITVSKKVGKSVVRNRVKRLIREYYRLNKDLLSCQWDYHLIAKKQASTLSYEQISDLLTKLFGKLPQI